MISDKQFDDAFTAAGGWFFLTQYEIIKNWSGPIPDLIDTVYGKGFDKNRSGSSARVSSALRMIKHGRDLEALIKIRDSATIHRQHPEAEAIASDLIARYFPE